MIVSTGVANVHGNARHGDHASGQRRLCTLHAVDIEAVHPRRIDDLHRVVLAAIEQARIADRQILIADTVNGDGRCELVGAWRQKHSEVAIPAPSCLLEHQRREAIVLVVLRPEPGLDGERRQVIRGIGRNAREIIAVKVERRTETTVCLFLFVTSPRERQVRCGCRRPKAMAAGPSERGAMGTRTASRRANPTQRAGMGK